MTSSVATRLTGASRNVSKRGGPSLSPGLSAELAALPTAKSGSLRRFAEYLAESRDDRPENVAGIVDRLKSMERGELRLWDALAIAQSVATLKASPQDQRFDILFLNIAHHLHALGTSQMSPRTLIDTLCLFEVLKIRPKALYVDVMHQLVRQTTAMYPDELTGLLVTMARIGLSSPAMLDRIAASIRHSQLQNIRYLHGCEVVGAMAALGYDNSAFYAALDSRMKMCAEMMPVEEVWDTVKYLPSLQYSWKPYERSIWDELSRRTSKFYNELHVDEVSDPVSFMQFLRLHKRLDKRFMSAMAAWARVTVYRPTSRTSRRPTARELALIVDYCQEYGVGAEDADNKHVLHKAVRTFVGSRGGQQETKLNRRPLLYMRRRRYVRADDPYVKANQRPLTIRRPLRNGGVWKSSREAQISSAEGGARKAMWNYWLLPKIYQM
ncbi:hypothetical protein FOZ63_024459 [Perkinsus olseni]|uniref:Uncharacterized protein n=1 Tax=Perkinsus olseni TaxID=32597 RepID=A0A7J6TDT2_PEROL|nr:hypothetical protein FOZ63_024459 [Perkinsus olseni]